MRRAQSPSNDAGSIVGVDVRAVHCPVGGCYAGDKMSDPLRRLEDMPVAEQTKVLAEIKEFLLKIIYSEVLPRQSLEQQIETLKTLERIEKGTTSTPTKIDDDAGMLAEVMNQVQEILS